MAYGAMHLAKDVEAVVGIGKHLDGNEAGKPWQDTVQRADRRKTTLASSLIAASETRVGTR
jgi:hypothetical protein